MKLDINNPPKGFKIHASDGIVVLIPVEDCVIVTNKETVQKTNGISVDVPKGARFSLFCLYGISEFHAQSKPIEKLETPEGFSPFGGIWYFDIDDVDIETSSEIETIYEDMKADKLGTHLYEGLKTQSNQIFFVVIEQEEGSRYYNTLEIVSTKEAAIKLIENKKQFQEKHNYKPHKFTWYMHNIWELE